MRRSARIAAKPQRRVMNADIEEAEEFVEQAVPLRKYESDKHEVSDFENDDTEDNEDIGANESENDDLDNETDRVKRKARRTRGALKKQNVGNETSSYYAADPSGKPTADQITAIMNSSVAKLKEALRRNDQIQSGNKSDLQNRVIACIRNGCFPKCPKCFTGRLRVSQKAARSGALECPGHIDDEGKFSPCGFWQGNPKYEDLIIVRPAWTDAADQSI